MSNWDPRMDDLDRLLAEDAKPAAMTSTTLALEMAREWLDQMARNEPETVSMRRLAALLERYAGERLEEVERAVLLLLAKTPVGERAGGLAEAVAIIHALAASTEGDDGR